MPDQYSLPPLPRRSESRKSNMSHSSTDVASRSGSPSATPPLLSSPMASIDTSPMEGSGLSPTNSMSPTFRSKRKPVPLNLGAAARGTSPGRTASSSGAGVDANLEQQLRTSAYVNSRTNSARSGNSSPGRPVSVILTQPTPPPRTSSAIGLGIDCTAPIDLAPPISGALAGVPNSRIHYLRAARQSPQSGQQQSDSESGGSPLSEAFVGVSSSSSGGSPRTISASAQEGSSTPPSTNVHLDEKPRQGQVPPPSSTFHPLDHLKDSELNKTLPSLPPPSIYDPSSKSKSKAVEDFSVDAIPEPIKLWEASQCYVTDELGRPRKFGEFWDRTDIRLDPDMYKKRVSVEKAYRKKEIKEAKRAGSTASGGRSDAGSMRSMRSSSSIHSVSTTGTPSVAGSRPGTPASGINGNRRDSAATIKAGSTEKPAEILCGGEEHNQPGRRTVIFWIRHFWCGQCQDYTFASLSQLDTEAINAAGLNVIVISNGSWKIIRRYREIFNCPYPIYVDGSRKLYQLMGMTKLSNDFGPSKDRASYHRAGAPVQLARGIGNALFKMPIADPGKLTQLGGEFVLGPGLQCTFAHRMTNTSNHLEANDVMAEAGCDSCTIPSRAARALAEEELATLALLQQEEAEWREGRTDELRRMQESKAERRGAPQYAESVMSMGTGMEDRRLSSITEPEDGETSRKGSVATIPGEMSFTPVAEESDQVEQGLGERGLDESDIDRRPSAASDVSGGYGQHAFSPDRAAFIAEYSKNRQSVPIVSTRTSLDDSRSMDQRSIMTHTTDAFALDDHSDPTEIDLESVMGRTESGRSSYVGDGEISSVGRLSRLTLDPATPIVDSARSSVAGFGGGGLRKLSAFGLEEPIGGQKGVKV